MSQEGPPAPLTTSSANKPQSFFILRQGGGSLHAPTNFFSNLYSGKCIGSTRLPPARKPAQCENVPYVRMVWLHRDMTARSCPMLKAKLHLLFFPKKVISGHHLSPEQKGTIVHWAILRAIKTSFHAPVLVGRPPLAGEVEIAEGVSRRQRPLAPRHVVAHVDEDQVAAVEVAPEMSHLK